MKITTDDRWKQVRNKKKNNEGGLRFAEKIRHKKNRMFWWKKKQKKKLILESIAGFSFSQYFVRYFAFRVD